MSFNYKFYCKLIEDLCSNNYTVTDYFNYLKFEKCVILRHDVDMDLSAATDFAEYEHSLGVYSTYYFLVSSNFYNIFSKDSLNLIEKIKNYGNIIGLHFDEAKYGCLNADLLEEKVNIELELMGKMLGYEIDTFSMHRPSKSILSKALKIKGKINSYDSIFFEKFKYLSDSRMNWREDIIRLIKGSNFDRLHILTHPIWYFYEGENINEVLVNFLKTRLNYSYEYLQDNITNLNINFKTNELRDIIKNNNNIKV